MVKEIYVLPKFTKGKIKFKDIPLFHYNTTLKTELMEGLSKTFAIRLLEAMLYTRKFEEMIIRLKSGKYLPYDGFKFIGATHLSIGQEAVAAGTMAALNADDYITSTHRGHGHSICKVLFKLYSMKREGLLGFIGEKDSKKTTEELLEEAIGLHLFKTMAELLGKEEGYCRGRGGSMHIADFHSGHLGANAIVGGSMAIATGAALSSLLQGQKKVVACMVGDGATNNGICIESMNFASVPQFGEGFPAIFIIENNQYGMTGQQQGEVTGIPHLSRRGAGFNENNMHARTESGMHILSVLSAVSEACDICRKGKGPVLLEFKTYRYYGHSLSDKRVTYRVPEEEKEWLQKDPILLFSKEIVNNKLMTTSDIESLTKNTEQKIEEITLKAAKATDPKVGDIYYGLFSDTKSEDIGDKYKTVKFNKQPKQFKRDSAGKILYRHAVIEALTEEMSRDNRVVLYGEDVAEYGGAFQATVGLYDIFGRRRVFNTPISEAAIIGTGLGAAMTGLRPVVEIMYIDFILMAGDQLGNQVAKTKYMFGGKAKIPLVIRTTIGGGKGYAGQHSQSLEAFPAQFPGLKVVAPYSAYDVKGLLKASIRDDNPVFFIEHQHLYIEKDVVPEEDYTIPLGKGIIRREGKDVSVISYSHQLKACIEAADILEKEDGVKVEIVDPRTLVPLDTQLIVDSVSKTGRGIVVVQAPGKGSFGEHIIRVVQEQAFDRLKGPLKLISAHEVPPPMAQTLELENLPNAAKIVKSIRDILAL
ncbi:MAG: dehydrogenase E1 component subunit alpha/beta [Spirochaetota bacterium]|nr:MAG: dehydrogenase E1 component subunit alpha/beta [Spirochaetota bacterium]